MGLRTWIYKKTGIKLKKFNIKNNKEILNTETLPNAPVIAVQKTHPFKNVDIASDVYLSGNIEIGEYTYVRARSTVREAQIGRYCSIAANVQIAPYPHPTNWMSTHYFQWSNDDGEVHNNNHKIKKTLIVNDVWIGTQAIVIDGVTIGDGAIIGANAVVTKDVPSYAIVGGVPAKIIRYRFDEPTIQELLKLKWWELEPDQMQGIMFEDIHTAIAQIKQIKQKTLASR